MEAGKAEAQRSRIPWGSLVKCQEQAERQEPFLAPQFCLYLDLYICKAIYQPFNPQFPTLGS